MRMEAQLSGLHLHQGDDEKPEAVKRKKMGDLGAQRLRLNAWRRRKNFVVVVGVK